jgi:predicted RNA-binding protein
MAALPPNPTRADYDREIVALNAQIATLTSQLATANATIAARDVALAACDAEVQIVEADHALCVSDLTAANVERDKHRAVTNGLAALVVAGQAVGIEFVVEGAP